MIINESIRLGRNDICWCGSGQKFKKCHMNREQMPQRSIQEIIEMGKAAYAKKYCIHPDPSACNNDIIQTHSLQKNGGLSRIAVKGQVYGIRENNCGDIAKNDGLITPKLVSVSKASTFTGLCGFHDNRTFEPIEKHPFTANEEHCFLLGYRHFCKEVFTKRAVMSLLPELRTSDRGRPLIDQISHQRFMDIMQPSTTQGSTDVETIKTKYNFALMSKDYVALKYYVVRFNEVPDVLVCSGNFPRFDFEGTELQRILRMNVLPDHVNFSVIATNSGGAAVFSYLGHSPAAEGLIISLHRMSDADVPNAIIRHTFEYCENSYLYPVWWDSLPDSTKTAIRHRITTTANVAIARVSNCLMDDGIQYVKWTVAGRETNIKF